MVWTTPKTWASNEIPTAANLNLQLRDNFLEMEPAKATKPSQLVTQGSTDPDRVNLTSFTTRMYDVPNVNYIAASAGAYTSREPLVTVPRASGYLISYGARQHKLSGTGSIWFFPILMNMYSHSAHKIRTADTAGVRQNNTVLFDASLVPGLFPDYSATTYQFGLAYGADDEDTRGLWAQRYISVLPLGLLDLWCGVRSRSGFRRIRLLRQTSTNTSGTISWRRWLLPRQRTSGLLRLPGRIQSSGASSGRLTRPRLRRPRTPPLRQSVLRCLRSRTRGRSWLRGQRNSATPAVPGLRTTCRARTLLRTASTTLTAVLSRARPSRRLPGLSCGGLLRGSRILLGTSGRPRELRQSTTLTIHSYRSRRRHGGRTGTPCHRQRLVQPGRGAEEGTPRDQSEARYPS